MKRFSILLLLFFIILMAIPACSKHKQEKTAEELAEEGKTYFEKKDYKGAIESYEKLTDWYPFSTHAKEAELKIADSHYHLDEYEQAIAAYNEFSQLHPRDPQIAYVLYQIGRCYYDQLEQPDRDQTPALNAIDAFQNLTMQFPDSDYSKEVSAYIDECLKNLAEKEMYVGKFYFKSRHYKAARERFVSVIKNYPDFGLHQEARDYIDQCNTHMAEIIGSDS
ncbi:MAG: outer membrane protein assembly factor BamD [Desulfobacterales bacterium]|nr:outer membrane protein assembly factor BamD [Desulfobacterales bacterium]